MTEILDISQQVSIQFTKSQEFSNVKAIQIFERRVLLTVLNGRKIFKLDILLSGSVTKSATQKPWDF